MQTTPYLAAALLCCASAHATTAQETAMLQAPAPHQANSGGAQVKVHRARLDGYMGAPDSQAAMLADLRQQVDSCVRAHAGGARPVHPPAAWPDHVISHREEQYTAANRAITYTYELGHVVTGEDCSLLASVVSRAVLVSAKGVCKIDLDRKTARGECGADGHADAPPPRHDALPPARMAAAMAGNPALAAAMRGVAQLAPVRTGEQRGILGARCDVWTQPLGADTATQCYAVGGAFLPYRAPNGGGYGGLLLDSATRSGYQLKAVEVRMDTTVGGAVFTPYAAGGYTVSRGGAQ